MRLASGAEMRVTGPTSQCAVVCVNGGQAREVEGTWSASVEWLVRQLAPRLPGVGFAEVGFRTTVHKEQYEPAADALMLAMFAGDRLPSLGAQFVITAKPKAKVSEKTVPIGRCEGSNPVQQIVNQTVTANGIPVTETVVRSVEIVR